MKKFDLDSVQLVDLNDVELEELGEYLIYRYDEISEQEWVKLDYKFRCGLRRSKLEQLGRL